MVMDAPTMELPVVVRKRARIVWPRVIALTVIMLVSASGAFMAMRDVATRTSPASDTEVAFDPVAPAAPRVGVSVSEGPRLGDLRGLVEYAPEPVTTPRPVTRSATTSRRVTPRQSIPPNFQWITGAHTDPNLWRQYQQFRRSCPRSVCGRWPG